MWFLVGFQKYNYIIKVNCNKIIDNIYIEDFRKVKFYFCFIVGVVEVLF